MIRRIRRKGRDPLISPTASASSVKAKGKPREPESPRTVAAEARLVQAIARTELAEARTELAKTRTELAETRAEQAESRTELAKTRTENAESFAEQMESEVEHLLVSQGGPPLPDAAKFPGPEPSSNETKAQHLSLIRRLTTRQKEILQLIAEGRNTKQIGEAFRISPKTVEYHRVKLMARLDVHDISGLVRFAMRAGLIADEK